jgi:hypothetical protein
VSWNREVEVVMADISMCIEKECKLKDDCYRFKAKPSEYGQSYFLATLKENKKGCDMFWSINKQVFELHED